MAAIYPIPAAYTTPVSAVPPEYDMNNTTVSHIYHIGAIFVISVFFMVLLHSFVLQVYVGNLDLNVTEEELKQAFMQFADIVSVKIHAGKGFGFVQFGTRFFFFPLSLCKHSNIYVIYSLIYFETKR